MGLTYADIELINADDLAAVRRRIIDEDEVKRMHVNMLVDSGAYIWRSMRIYRSSYTAHTREAQSATR